MTSSENTEFENDAYSLTQDILNTCNGKLGTLALCSCLNAAMTILQNSPENSKDAVFKATSATLKDMAEVLDIALSGVTAKNIH